MLPTLLTELLTLLSEVKRLNLSQSTIVSNPFSLLSLLGPWSALGLPFVIFPLEITFFPLEPVDMSTFLHFRRSTRSMNYIGIAMHGISFFFKRFSLNGRRGLELVR